MPHPVVRNVNRDDGIHTFVEQEAALGQLGLQKLLFVDLIGKLRSPSPMSILVVFLSAITKIEIKKRKVAGNKPYTRKS